MAGIFDFLQTPQGQGLLAAGLGVAANAGRGGTWNALGRGGLMGLQGYAGAQNQQAEAAERAKMGELRDMQIAQYRAAASKDAAKRAALPGLFRQPGITGGEAVPQTLGGIEMFSQPVGAAPVRATPGGFDVQGAISSGLFDADEIQKWAGVQDAGKPKATRQIEVDDGRGGKRIVLADDHGREVTGFAGYTAPVQVNRGDRVDFVKPAPGVSLGVNMSPSERDASARGWAGVNIQRDTASAGKVPAGYRMRADGSLEAIPGGPAALGKALPAKLMNDLTEQAQVADNTQRFVSTFNPEYGGKTVMGDMSNTSKRVFGDDTGQAQWWQDYGLHEAQARNKLFGASLTPGEQGAWLKLAVTPRMDPRQIEENLKRRAEIEQVGLERLTKGAAAGGYNAEQIEAVTGRPISASKPKPASSPVKGQTVDGYRFKGGNPADQANWERQ